MIEPDAGSPFARYRLPSGRHGLPREVVAENQRLRLLGACAEEIADDGYARLTTAGVARRAGVSPTALYRHFGDLPSCVVATHAIALECLYEVVSDACERERTDRLERSRAGIEAMLRFALAEPALARLLGPAMPWQIGEAVGARTRLLSRVAALASIDPLLIGGALAFLGHRVSGDEAERFQDLAPELAVLIGTQKGE